MDSFPVPVYLRFMDNPAPNQVQPLRGASVGMRTRKAESPVNSYHIPFRLYDEACFMIITRCGSSQWRKQSKLTLQLPAGAGDSLGIFH